MHVVLLTSGRIFGISHGGEDRFSYRFGSWLANQNHEVTLIGIDYAGLKVRHLPSGINLKQGIRTKSNVLVRNKSAFSLVRIYRYFSYSLRSIIWIFQVLRLLSINLTSQITLINAQDSGYTGLAAIVVARILRIPAIISLHGIRYKEIESNPFLNNRIKKIVLNLEKKLDRFILNNADLITVVSPIMTGYVKQLAPDRDIHVLPVAIKSKNFDYSKTDGDVVRSQLGIKKNASVIGYIGRLSHEKNLFMLMESFAKASINHPHMILVLVGQGMLEMALKKMANELNIESKTIFCGIREDIAAILSSFDIFVLPSLIEGLSNALLEAMASGRAIICSNIDGNRTLITNNIEGILIDPKDSESLTLNMELLLRDQLLREKLGKNAKIKAQKYDENKVFPKILNKYLAISQHSR